MRAVVYDKPFSVTVRDVPKPTILHPDDIIVRGERPPVTLPIRTRQPSIVSVTTTCICGRYGSVIPQSIPSRLPVV